MVLIHLYVTHQAGLRNRYLVSNRLSGPLFFSSQTILKASKKSTKPSTFKPGLSAWNSTGTVWCVMCDHQSPGSHGNGSLRS